HTIISGYPCGGPGEPCNSSQQPYFRPGKRVRQHLGKLGSGHALAGAEIGLLAAVARLAGATAWVAADDCVRVGSLHIREEAVGGSDIGEGSRARRIER